MLAGKRFRLRSPSAAIDFSSGFPLRVKLPTGTILRVIDDPSEGSLVDALYDGRMVYAVRRDLELHGEEFAEKKPVASTWAASCPHCRQLLSNYQRSVTQYSHAVGTLHGALESDYAAACGIVQKMWQMCRKAHNALMDHKRTHLHVDRVQTAG